jgi:hypothetical protein
MRRLRPAKPFGMAPASQAAHDFIVLSRRSEVQHVVEIACRPIVNAHFISGSETPCRHIPGVRSSVGPFLHPCIMCSAATMLDDARRALVRIGVPLAGRPQTIASRHRGAGASPRIATKRPAGCAIVVSVDFNAEPSPEFARARLLPPRTGHVRDRWWLVARRCSKPEEIKPIGIRAGASLRRHVQFTGRAGGESRPG